MITKIFKYKVLPGHVNVYKVPKGTKILSAYTQLTGIEEIYFWALVPNNVTEEEELRIATIGTGENELPEEVGYYCIPENFIATIHFRHTPDPMVYHLFNVTKS